MRSRFRIAMPMMALATLVAAGGAAAQQQPPQFPNMSFFITSTGGPKGADYGGLAAP